MTSPADNTQVSAKTEDTSSCLPKRPVSTASYITLRLGTTSSEETFAAENYQDDPSLTSSDHENGVRLLGEVHHHDPGIVNVHQFYPVLECTFTRPQLGNVEEESLSTLSRRGSPLDKTVEELIQPHTVEDADKRGCHENVELTNDKEENKTEGKEDSDDVEGQTVQVKLQEVGVFPTSVDEESIEAARQRMMRGGGHQKVGAVARIASRRGNEYFQRAMKMKEDNNLMAVISFLTKAINLRPDDPVLYMERGEAYLRLCDFQSAILNYRKANLLAAGNTSYLSRLAFLYYFQGQTLFDQKLFPEALELFTRASQMFPENDGYHMRCITCVAAMQRYDECLIMVNKRLVEDKNNPDLYILRARLHEKFRNASSCYKDVKHALLLEPHHSEGQAMMDAVVKRARANKLLSMELSIAGRHKEALHKISSAIQANPDVADFHVLRGAIHRKLNDFSSAIDDFLLAMDKCEHNEQADAYKNSQRQLLLTFNDFAVECFKKGCYEEAIVLLNRALREEKNEKSLYVNRGDCFFQQKELNFALEDYQQALELDPQDQSVKFRISLVHNELGVELHQDRKYPDAEVKFSMALEYSPLIGQYYISRCRTRCMTGINGMCYEKNSSWLFRTAVAYILQQTQNLPGAREDVLLGLILSPRDEGVLPILSRLFPGKSCADVLKSPALTAAQLKVDNLVFTEKSLQKAIPGLPSNITDHKGSSDVIEDTTKTGYSQPQTDKTLTSSSFVMCMEDQEFYVEQLQEKRKVEHKVKDALVNRRSLRYTGPQLLPLQSFIPLTSGRLQVLHADDGVKTVSKPRGTNWKHFNLGLVDLRETQTKELL